MQKGVELFFNEYMPPDQSNYEKKQWLKCAFLFSERNMERDRFMTPEEACKFGLIDKVLEHPPTLEDEQAAAANKS